LAGHDPHYCSGQSLATPWAVGALLGFQYGEMMILQYKFTLQVPLFSIFYHQVGKSLKQLTHRLKKNSGIQEI
jgi:hypothetical protein